MNKDIKTRDDILEAFFTDDGYCGGIRTFKDAPMSIMQKLYDGDFMDPDDHQNLAPSNKELVKFIKDNITVVASGYVVSDQRNDYGVIIDSISGSASCSPENVVKLTDFARSADDFYLKPLGNLVSFGAWWD